MSQPEQELWQFLILSQGSSQQEDTTHGMQWTRHDTFCLLCLHLYKEYRKQVGSLRIKSLRRMCEEIAKEMRQETKKNVSPSNCANRWKHLERMYKKVKDNNAKTGRGRKTFEYWEELDDILGKQKNMNPILAIASTEVDNNLPGTQFLED
ncbi:uncharacterized protein LOC126891413 [Diabrotica virgifera virgifera]|uniref:Myb/SANT-like DNA-binding domain-containing protein n=1 Tax=Diabrotica virgifera virgifera TaxID=50390 RepID=A0ABM5L279_DIAVI|nr:uncharacterized protein LOC126891413 [Diabrotica virgifera virgifera]